MPYIKIRTSNIQLDDMISPTIFNYPDSSILSYIMETLHLGITEPVKIYRKGEILYVVSSK